jgi:hypothetical protein
MAFEGMHELNTQLGSLLFESKQRGNRRDQRRIEKFVLSVINLVDLAYDDVRGLLASIAHFANPTITSSEIASFQVKLSATHSSEKFRDILKICEALQQLSATHIAEISAVVQEDQRQQFDHLFSLMTESEEEFRDTIRESLWEISQELEAARSSGSPSTARRTATVALKDLEECQEEVRRLEMSIRGTLSGPHALLDLGHEATIALQRSPWYSGSFFLGTALLLLTGLTVVVGKMPLKSFLFVVVATYVGLVLIAAFTLFRDRNLSEAGLVAIIRMAMLRVLVPVMGKAK